jgi:anti-anti-sigma factor
MDLQNIQSPPLLLVDDDKLVLIALMKTIERAGFNVLTAQNGKEAIEILKKHTVALIICDQRMPDLLGVEVLKQALLIQPNAIRIILTANQDLKTVLEAINIGQISQFILKPWDEASLIQTISTSFDKYRLTKENQLLHELTLEQNQELARNHERLKRDLELGAHIYATLLLGKIPTITKGFEIGSLSIPSREIDGDFFAFYQPSTYLVDLLIGDVMGKGIPAALVGTAIKTQFIRFAIPYSHVKKIERGRHWEEDLLTPHEIVNLVHDELATSLICLEYFVSLLYARFDFHKRSLLFINSGFTPPIHYSTSTQKAELIPGGNLPMGSVIDNYYDAINTDFLPGDIFIFVSDGISEAMSPNHEMYGCDPLIQIVQDYSNEDPESLINRIKLSLKAFTQKEVFDDDVTLLIIKISQSGAPLIFRETSAKFFAHLSQLQNVRSFIQRICHWMPGDAEKMSIQLQLAINEIFCNIVQHGYKGRDKGSILIEVKLKEDGVLIEIADQGATFDPSTVKEPSLAGDQESGFGWYIVREIADCVTYMQKKSKMGWNHTSLFKKFIQKGIKMHITHSIQNDVLIITPQGDSLDAKDASEFKEDVSALIRNANQFHVVFDLQHIQFVDSSGLGAFLSVLRLLHSNHGELKLAELNKAVRTMFELVSMHKIFEIYNSTEEAIKSFTRAT